jgi:uncharacterized protein
MNRIGFASAAAAALLLAGTLPAAAQDARKVTSLKLPAARTATARPPAVADAAMQDDAAAVKKLIASGADVNTAEGDGMTALHWAADHGDSAMAAALLKAHANVKATTRIGAYTPLHLAARAGSGAVVKMLLDAGADAKAVTNSGTSALHFAAEAGNPAAVSDLIDKGADVNAREPEWGQTPLVFAAENDRAAAIKVLLAKGADPMVHTRVVKVQEETAREQAAKKKRDEVLKMFEPPARRDSADADFKASQQAAQASLATLGGGARGAGGGGGRAGRRGGGGGAGAGAADATPPVTAQDSAAVLGLAGAGAGPNPLRAGATRAPRGPFTPSQIQAAIDSGRAVFLSKSAATGPVKEEVDTLNGGVAGFLNTVGGVGGLSPLHHAVRQGNLDAVVALLDGGAKINDVSDVDHTTPLLEAAINGQFDVAMKLIERGADVNAAASTGFAPLYAVINTQWAPKSRYPQPQALQNQQYGYLDVMEALLKAGANPNVRVTQAPFYFAYNNCGNANCGLEQIEGTTPFWRAAYAVDVDAMKLLVKYKADVTLASIPPARGRGGRGGGGGGGGGGGAAGGRGAIPGFGGPAQANLPEIDSLAKIAPVGTGVLPIHAAAGVGYGNGFAGNSHRHAPDGWMPAMKYMVEVLHADVNARDNQGMTPLHHAAARGDNEMILYLVAHGADVKAVSRNGRTVVDMANGPVQRLRPFPETIALLEKLGAVNQHHCVSC